jgi:hypothetical protein
MSVDRSSSTKQVQLSVEVGFQAERARVGPTGCRSSEPQEDERTRTDLTKVPKILLQGVMDADGSASDEVGSGEEGERAGQGEEGGEER